MFGLPLFTFIHVVISLVAIASGLVVLIGLLSARRMKAMTAVFLLFTAATNVTGFLFPIKGLTPALILGLISSVVLLLALAALYRFRLRGIWRPIYAISAVAVLYFNVFVLIVQSFQKLPALHGVSPNIAQGVALVLFVLSGGFAAVRFRPA
jgi:ABC-type multidrug transport system permease subunit